MKLTDLEPYRGLGGRAVIELALSGTRATRHPMRSARTTEFYAGDRYGTPFPTSSATSISPELAELLGSIATPVRIVGNDDQVVLPPKPSSCTTDCPSRVDFIKGAGTSAGSNGQSKRRGRHGLVARP